MSGSVDLTGDALDLVDFSVAEQVAYVAKIAVEFGFVVAAYSASASYASEQQLVIVELEQLLVAVAVDKCRSQ